MNVTTAVNTIFKTSWGWSRWIRLGIGTAFLFDAYAKQSEMVAFFGVFLVFQAAFNTGCGLGSASCSSQSNETKTSFDISHNFIQLNKK